jgi:glucokinase
MDYAIGIDIGGTKIAAAILDEEGSVLSRCELKSNVASSERMFLQVTDSVRQVVERSQLNWDQLVGIGVGVPGKIDKQNGMAIYQNNIPWVEFPIVKRLKKEFPFKKIVMDNDVYMATFSEWNLYGADPNETFVYFTVSTGISCAIIHKGKFLRGMGFAGEIGLLPVKSPNGTERLEQTASGPAMEGYTNYTMTTKQLFENFNAKKNEYAERIISNTVESIAHGCYALGCIIDPAKVVFGGGIVNNNPFLLELVQEKLREYCIPEQQKFVSRLYLSKSKGDAGVLGAGLSVFHE